MSRDPGSDALAGDSDSGRGPGRRRQQAGFSIFLDQMVDAQGRQQWETRLYHAESGVETTLDGASPEEWIGWILERIGRTEIGIAEPQRARWQATADVLSVEVLDVPVAEDSAGRDGSRHTIAAHVVVQLAREAVPEPPPPQI